MLQVHCADAQQPLVWEVQWTLAEGAAGGPEQLAELRGLLEGGLILRPPERWLGIPVRHAWSRLNGRWRRAAEEGTSFPAGSAIPFSGEALDRSALLLRSRMLRKGYLDGTLSMDTTLAEGRVSITVTLDPGMRYRVSRADVRTEGSGVEGREREALVDGWGRWKGRPLDLDELERERNRFSADFQQRGWFGLTSDFFTVEVDTTDARATGMVGLELVVSPAARGGRTGVHRKARLDSLSFEWHPLGEDIIVERFEDGILWRVPQGRDIRGLNHALHIKPGQGYDPGVLTEARQAIRRLPLVKDLRVDIAPMGDPNDSLVTPLHVHFDAYPSQRRVMKVNGAATSRQGLGGEMALSISDQDFRRRMEQVALDFGAGVENVTTYGLTESGEDAGTTFISRILSAGVSYNAARIIPFGPDRFAKSNRPESLVAFTLRDENRRKFNRTLLQFSLTERFVENPANGSRVELRPVDIAVTSSKFQAGFEEELDSLGSDVLTSSFTSRAVFASGVAWRVGTKKEKRSLFRGQLSLEWEGAGNLFHLLDGRTPSETTVAMPTFFQGTADVQVARYTRWLIEATGGWSIDRRNGWFARCFIGVASSSIDGVAVPLEKQFYVGGPNSMRGWQALGLGPGGSGYLGLRVRGDIRVEANLEWRRYVNDWIQCAVFADAGNIWMTRPEASRPDVELDPSTFLGQVAVNLGGGIRFDFGYFLLRCDAGIPVKWPDGTELTDQRWRFHPAVSLPF